MASLSLLHLFVRLCWNREYGLSLDAALSLVYCLNMRCGQQVSSSAWLVILTNSSSDNTMAVCFSTRDRCTEFPACLGQDREPDQHYPGNICSYVLHLRHVAPAI